MVNRFNRDFGNFFQKNGNQRCTGGGSLPASAINPRTRCLWIN